MYQVFGPSHPALHIVTPSATLPLSCTRCLLVARCTGCEELDPLTSRESFKPSNQLRTWDHTSTWRSVQQHPWQQHEQFPAPLLPHFIVATIAPRSFFQRQFQCVPERASQKMENTLHHSSSLTEDNSWVNLVQRDQRHPLVLLECQVQPPRDPPQNQRS